MLEARITIPTVADEHSAECGPVQWLTAEQCVNTLFKLVDAADIVKGKSIAAGSLTEAAVQQVPAP